MIKTPFLNYILVFGLTGWLMTALLASPSSGDTEKPTQANSPSPTTPDVSVKSDNNSQKAEVPEQSATSDEQKYVVVLPQVPIRKEIPLDNNDNIYNGKEIGDSDDILVKHDIVRLSDKCEQKKQFDDWLCVTFVQYGDHHQPRSIAGQELKEKPELKTGWVFRYSMKKQESKKKWIILAQEFTPYTTKEGDKVVSFMDKNGVKITASSDKLTIVKIIEDACEKSNIDCKLEIDDWNKAQKRVKNGQAEGLFVIGEKSRGYLLFSSQLTKTKYVFFVNQKNLPGWKYKGPADLGDKKVTAYAKSSTCTVLHNVMKKGNFEEGKLIDCEKAPETSEEAFQLLRDGKVDIVFSSKDVGEHILNGSEIKSYLPIDYDNKDVIYHIGIRETVDSQKFFEELEKLLKD